MNEKRISVSNAEGPLFLYKMRIRGFSLGCPFCVLECTIRFSLFLEVARFGFRECTIKVSLLYSSPSSSSSVSIAPSSSSSSPAVVSLLPVTVSEASRNDSSSQAETAEPEPVMNQRYDLQLIGRWMEQILPFCLLLLTVFIRQHLQG